MLPELKSFVTRYVEASQFWRQAIPDLKVPSSHSTNARYEMRYQLGSDTPTDLIELAWASLLARYGGGSESHYIRLDLEVGSLRVVGGGAPLSSLFVIGSGDLTNSHSMPVTVRIIDIGSVELSFDSNIFGHGPVERLVGHFETLIAGLVSNPDRCSDEIEMLTEAERRQIEVDFNDTAIDFGDATLTTLFERCAEDHPDMPAVTSGLATITYQQLNNAANQVAHYLREQHQIGPDAVVGVSLERDWRMVAVLLGILKAGGAYLPLDPGYPADRLNFMVNDAGVATVIDRWPDIRTQPECNPTPVNKPDDLAYVIYTSGSTGKPKGVAVLRRGLDNLLLSMRTTVGVSQTDRLLSVTAIMFDIVNLELYLPLITGAHTVLATREQTRSPTDLASLITSHQITVMQATPSVWRMLTDTVPEALNGIHALTGGEALPPQLARHLLAHVRRLTNLYGPTETTIWSTATEITTNTPIAIGRPIANTQAFIVDHRGHLAAIGIPGELLIGGAGVARGYLNRPELTACRFTQHHNTRLYHTGDLARWLPGGQLDYLGRIDHQVKIRGHRIELGEIEATISRHSDVSTSVVTVREDTFGDKRLIAYYVATDTLPDLRDVCQHTLPDHMLPVSFIRLDALPLTDNGKIDRKALPAPSTCRPDLTAQFVAPRNPTEEAVAAIWCDVLGIKYVGIHDNFFELGGDSLIAMRVINRMDALVTARDLFTAPTVAALAAIVSASPTGGRHRLIARPTDTLSVPLSSGQQGLWFLDQMNPGSTEYLTYHFLELSGPLSVEALQSAFTQIVARHEILRTRFLERDDVLQQIIDPPSTFRLETIDADGRDPRHLIGPMDLDKGPLIRAILLRETSEDHQLLVVLHHIISDAWSVRILADEIGRLYAGEILPDVPLQYADYAIWEREIDIDKTQIDYWCRTLADIVPLELAADHSRPAIRTGEGASLDFILPGDISAFARQENFTTFNVLATAFQILLTKCTGNHDITIGVPVATRTHPDTENLIGFFVNTVALRVNSAGNPTIRQLLHRTSEAALEAYANQNVPFERVVKELTPNRNLNRTPVFQAMFAGQRDPERIWNFADVNVVAVELPSTTEKFDLTVHVRETDVNIHGRLSYSTDLFEPSTMHRLIDNYVAILEAVVTQPDAAVDTLPWRD
ncbi:amino acid adenylation domain-containing protein [Streptomyces sp. NPDC005953]|uniref:amino acid adenylation domain-containing protein n=1 Tax=Streptomyces sp. NPDC005953 TaxID=3156719 RepID=UPI0033F1D4CF